MKRKFIVSLIIFGMVFSSINIDFKSVKADTEIKFRGTAIEYFSIIGGWGWYVIVDEVISGPSGLQGHNVSVGLAPLPPDQYPPGYMDPHIEPGDKVEVYGLYQGEGVALYGSNDYYIRIGSAEEIEVKLFLPAVVSGEKKVEASEDRPPILKLWACAPNFANRTASSIVWDERRSERT